MNFSSVPGIILWDRNVSGQEQDKSGREDLFLDLEQGEEDTGEGGFDSAGWQRMKRVSWRDWFNSLLQESEISFLGTVQMSESDTGRAEKCLKDLQNSDAGEEEN